MCPLNTVSLSDIRYLLASSVAFEKTGFEDFVFSLDVFGIFWFWCFTVICQRVDLFSFILLDVDLSTYCV